MTRQRITSIEVESATGTNKKYFEALNSALGVVPNMTRAMAQSPAVLEGYVSLNGALSKGTLGRRLGEQLALTLAGANCCDYCASAHSVLGKLAGLNEPQIAGALKGAAEDKKTATALNFAKVLVDKHGQINDADYNAVTAAGFTEGEIGEIVAHVALNVFTNYFNNVAKVEIDFPKVNVQKAA